MTQQQTEKQIEQITERFLTEISEYTDAAQVLLTYQEPGGAFSHAYKQGRGNFYARLGLAREFLLQDEVDVKSAGKGELQ